MLTLVVMLLSVFHLPLTTREPELKRRAPSRLGIEQNAVAHLFGTVHSSAVSTERVVAMRTDSVRAELSEAVAEFYAVWIDAWKKSERLRKTSVSWVADSIVRTSQFTAQMDAPARLMHTQCRTGTQGLDDDQFGRGMRIDYKAITSVRSALAVCPSWRLNELPRLPDEDRDIDAAIDSAFKSRVRAARDTLIERLAMFARGAPEDEVVVGQRVRFLIQQRMFADAHDVARECRPAQWWCVALQAFVRERQGQMFAADSSFARARTLMPDSVRCAWDDIRALLPESQRGAYVNASCRDREPLNARFWWMSDPLLFEPGNERKTVHDARRMTLLLNSAFSTDGRFHWDQPHVGDAMSKMIIRYGWPSYAAWGLESVDKNQTEWLEDRRAMANEPYTTFEYSTGRVHTVPEWSAVQNPFVAADTMWDLNARWDENLPALIWWPNEHFARSRPLTSMAEGQVAMLRRQNDIVVAVANNIDGGAFARQGDSSTAALIVTSAPESITVVQHKQTKRSNILTLHGHIPSQASVLAIELIDAAATGVDSRRRFGISPPPTLAAMKPGEVAVSGPVLVRPPPDAKDLKALGDAVVDHMFGSTRLSRRTPRVGVYWESYGFQAHDSVTVSVSIERRMELSALQRLAMALRLSGNPKSPISISWREPDPNHLSRTLTDAVPIQMRSIVLNLSRLTTGEYDLFVQVSRPGTPPARSHRALTIVE